MSEQLVHNIKKYFLWADIGIMFMLFQMPAKFIWMGFASG
jgi:hypothetical protein